MKGTKLKLIYLEWEDAILMTNPNGAAWFSADEIDIWEKQEDHIICEVGYLYKENKRHIVLINKVVKETPEWQETYGVIHKIPKSWIRKRIDLTKYIKGGDIK
jgi:hypothetical protein